MFRFGDGVSRSFGKLTVRIPYQTSLSFNFIWMLSSPLGPNAYRT